MGRINQASGIEEAKENFPDKQYLILMISNLSQGNDAIFNKNYYPPANQKRQSQIQNFGYNNDDGLLSNIPQHLLSAKSNRSLKLGLLSND